jgi:2Fe-2S ferredoxin
MLRARHPRPRSLLAGKARVARSVCSLAPRKSYVPKVTFIEFNGTEHVVDAEPGTSLMQIATDNLVPGILAECGGACSCATCHAYIDAAWVDRLPPRTEDESCMLEGALDTQPNSRLCCQVKMQAEWDGLTVRLPEHQA